MIHYFKQKDSAIQNCVMILNYYVQSHSLKSKKSHLALRYAWDKNLINHLALRYAWDKNLINQSRWSQAQLENFVQQHLRLHLKNKKQILTSWLLSIAKRTAIRPVYDDESAAPYNKSSICIKLPGDACSKALTQ